MAALPFGDCAPVRELHPRLCSPGLRLRRRPGGSAAPTLVCSFILVTSLQHRSEGSCWKPWVITEAGVPLCRCQVLTRKDVFFLTYSMCTREGEEGDACVCMFSIM